MNRAAAACALCLFILAIGACSSGPDLITDCLDARGIHAICGFQNPEDLALTDDGHSLIVSQFGSMDGSKSGNLALFDLETESLRIEFRGDAPASTGAVDWGDESCPGAPGAAFSPHGLDLDRRTDGRLRLLVVNHGGRESVEFFEVSGSGPSLGLEWRGCSIPPDGAYLNDIVGLPDGGFLTTHMMDRNSQLGGFLSGVLGFATGFVYEWQADRGYRVVPGTDGAMPNGIELSADAGEIYLSLYLDGEVRRISRQTGELLATADMTLPDNLTWGRDGRLLVASHVGGTLSGQLACADLSKGACPFAFEILSLDPMTLTSQLVFANEGPPMGAGTVAIDLGGELLIGSFAGDRIIRVRNPQR